MEKQEARQMWRDIEDRHSDIMKLETSLRDLHDMFQDLAVLVDSQVHRSQNVTNEEFYAEVQWKRNLLDEVMQMKFQPFAKHWTLTTTLTTGRQRQRLETFEIWIWRRMMKISWVGKISSEEVFAQVSETRTMLNSLSARKHRWIGHHGTCFAAWMTN